MELITVFRRFALIPNRWIERYDTAIAELVAHHPDAAVFASLPGIGPVTVVTLIAEIGEDRSRFPSAGSLLAEAGLAPVTRQSGGSRRVSFRYAANHHLRAIWQQWMLTAIRISAWTRDAYDTARARAQSHSRAVRSVGARWCRILWRCWQDGVPYDPGTRPSRGARRGGLMGQGLTCSRISPFPSRIAARSAARTRSNG